MNGSMSKTVFEHKLAVFLKISGAQNLKCFDARPFVEKELFAVNLHLSSLQKLLSP